MKEFFFFFFFKEVENLRSYSKLFFPKKEMLAFTFFFFEEKIGSDIGLVAQSYLTLGDPLDCSPPASSVHRILQARILEWVHHY